MSDIREDMIDRIERGVHSHTVDFIDGQARTTCHNGDCVIVFKNGVEIGVESFDSGLRSGGIDGGSRSIDAGA